MGYDNNPIGTDKNRRQILRRAAIGGTAIVAGCMGDGGDDGSGDSTDTDQNTDGGDGDGSTATPTDSGDGMSGDVPALLVASGERDPGAGLSGNPFGPANTGTGLDRAVLQDRMAVTNLAETDSYFPELAQDWYFEDGSFFIEIPNHTWHSGETVTAADIRTEFLIGGKYMGVGSAKDAMSQIDQVVAVDDQTVEIVPDGQINEFILRGLILDKVRLETPHHVFGDYIEQFEDLEADNDESGMQDVRAEIQELEVSIQEASSGPFRVVDASSDGVRAELHEDHFRADQFEFDEVFEVNMSPDLHEVATNSGDLHTLAIGSYDPGFRFGDNVKSKKVVGGEGKSLQFNHRVAPYNDRRVRKALAHLDDMDAHAERNSLSVTGRTTYNMCTGETNVQNIWTDDQIDSLEEYGRADEEMARAYLEDAGFTEEDGSWYKPNGEKWVIEIKSPISRVSYGREAEDSWRAFGIEVEHQTMSGSIYYSDNMLSDPPDYEVGVWGYSDVNKFPYFPWQKYYTEGGIFHISMGNPRNEVEVPMPYFDGSEGTEVIDVEQKLLDMASLQGDELIREIQEVGWIINQDVPLICHQQRVQHDAINVQNWSVPDTDDPIWTEMAWPWGEHRARHGLIETK